MGASLGCDCTKRSKGDDAAKEKLLDDSPEASPEADWDTGGGGGDASPQDTVATIPTTTAASASSEADSRQKATSNEFLSVPSTPGGRSQGSSDNGDPVSLSDLELPDDEDELVLKLEQRHSAAAKAADRVREYARQERSRAANAGPQRVASVGSRPYRVGSLRGRGSPRKESRSLTETGKSLSHGSDMSQSSGGHHEHSSSRDSATAVPITPGLAAKKKSTPRYMMHTASSVSKAERLGKGVLRISSLPQGQAKQWGAAEVSKLQRRRSLPAAVHFKTAASKAATPSAMRRKSKASSRIRSKSMPKGKRY